MKKDEKANAVIFIDSLVGGCMAYRTTHNIIYFYFLTDQFRIPTRNTYVFFSVANNLRIMWKQNIFWKTVLYRTLQTGNNFLSSFQLLLVNLKAPKFSPK